MLSSKRPANLKKSSRAVPPLGYQCLCSRRHPALRMETKATPKPTLKLTTTTMTTTTTTTNSSLARRRHYRCGTGTRLPVLHAMLSQKRAALRFCAAGVRRQISRRNCRPNQWSSHQMRCLGCVGGKCVPSPYMLPSAKRNSSRCNHARTQRPDLRYMTQSSVLPGRRRTCVHLVWIARRHLPRCAISGSSPQGARAHEDPRASGQCRFAHRCASSPPLFGSTHPAGTSSTRRQRISLRGSGE